MAKDAEYIPDVVQFVGAAVGALLIGALYFVLPESLSLGPDWLLLVARSVNIV